MGFAPGGGAATTSRRCARICAKLKWTRASVGSAGQTTVRPPAPGAIRIGHDASTGRKPRLVSARATTGFVCGLARTSASTKHAERRQRAKGELGQPAPPLLLGDLDAADVDRKLVDFAENARRLGALLAVVPEDQREALVAVELIPQERHVVTLNTSRTKLRRGGRDGPASAASDRAMAAPSVALRAGGQREDRQEPRDEGLSAAVVARSARCCSSRPRHARSA